MKTPSRGLCRMPGRFLFALLLMLAGGPAAMAQPVRVEAVEVELIAPTRALRAGAWEWLGLRIRHDPHWHTYWRNPGDSGLPTRLAIDAPPGAEVGELQWPRPERFLIAPLASYGYEGEVVLPIPIRVPFGSEGRPLTVEAAASWLMCRDVCIPGDASLRLTLPVVPDRVVAERSVYADLFERSLGRVPTRAVELTAAVGDTDVSVVLPSRVFSAGGGPPQVEFFPYAEQGVRHAAAQRLLALPAGSESPARLVLELSEDGRRLVGERGFARTELARGVLVIGEDTFELVPKLVTAAFAGGEELARLEAKPVVMPVAGASVQQGGRGGLLGAFIPGTGSYGGADIAAPGSGSLWFALVLAVLGGLVLNLMPCVFPVIGLKVLAFASHARPAKAATSTGLALPARAETAATRASALAFSVGVLLSFLLLGAIMLSLKSAGLAAGWGFQLQSPVFVTAMALLFVAIGLNLAGMFEIGLGLTQLARFDVSPGGRNQEGPRWLANAGSGALAVLVATPCTAPFMASALGFTLSASAVEALAVFVAIGLGMALPYLLLGWFPGWLRWLPKPGRWMESLRQALAFPMFITAAWLAWVLGQQAGIDAVLALAVGAIMIAFGAWCLGRFVQPRGVARARLATLLAIASLAGGLWLALSKADPVISGESSVRSSSVATSSGALGLRGGAPQSTGVDATASTAAWQTWSPQRVTEALAAGRPVFVDFTAAWCVSCQANKKLVLDRDGIVKAMADRGVLRLRADWTQRDPAITAELARHGRSGVPLYLLFEPASRAPRVLPELLTTGMVLEAMAAIPTRR